MNTHDPNMHQMAQGLTGPGAVSQRHHDGASLQHENTDADLQKHPLLLEIEAERRRNAQKFQSARRYSKRVRNLKIGLPILGGLFIVLFIAIAVISQFTSIPIGLATIDLTNGQIVMDRPTLNGFTSSNAEYELVAERALQDLDDPKKVVLEKIAATLTLDDGNIVSIEATEGKFDIDGQQLNLGEGVKVHTSAGYSGNLNDAMIDIKGSTLMAKGDVFIKADIGEIRADQMTVRDNGTYIFFEDRVRMTIQPEKIRQ